MKIKRLKVVKPIAHIVEKSLLNPFNPIIVNLIGAGGTGSQFLTALARMNHALIALHHPGLMVRLFDDDTVEPANLGRQLFTSAEIGMNKAVALINRINLFFGTNWKAVPEKYCGETLQSIPEYSLAELTVSCVDTVSARFEIAEILTKLYSNKMHSYHHPLYWLDCGNSRDTGQVILSTVAEIKQPASKKFMVRSRLPMVTEEFKELLQNAETTDNTPSCSLAEALTKQDLFINSALANLGASLLWQLFREGILLNRGFFLNLREFKTTPLRVA
ncbi:PRTRC system ThiF family protein [Mucilaginibacter sabulilitoris]|uniref:PRTRC system ThiF family protein n=1 Tax=Mucilaginibacter sabulilitoris TaxID=1173583 RepID=A0ABZ0TNG0_9SPHI|nr:PRTRC system ThiF family protein [Mucilaginibacter sabulilitoris]WPU94694.1 PRTRC system ThiF family protein [Mucilaginibacter sabulilitoris]